MPDSAARTRSWCRRARCRTTPRRRARPASYPWPRRNGRSGATLGVDTGCLAAEGVAVQDATDVGGVPLLGGAVLLGGEELLAHRPALVQREVVAHEAEHLARDVQRLVRGE